MKVDRRADVPWKVSECGPAYLALQLSRSAPTAVTQFSSLVFVSWPEEVPELELDGELAGPGRESVPRSAQPPSARAARQRSNVASDLRMRSPLSSHCKMYIAKIAGLLSLQSVQTMWGMLLRGLSAGGGLLTCGNETDNGTPWRMTC